MNFSGKNVESKNTEYVSKYLNIGIQIIRINTMEVQEASTGSLRMQFNCEGLPSDDPKFEGVDGARGPVGRVRSKYAKGEESQLEFIASMKDLANKIGREAQFNAIEAATFKEYMELLAASNVLCGVFFKAIVTGEDYMSNGKKRCSLGFSRYRFCEKADVPDSESKLKWNPQYHYKPIQTTSVGELIEATKDNGDLPF